jgi:hypothetical protein
LLFVVFLIIVLVLVVLGFLEGSGSVPSLIGLLSVNDLEITVDLVWLLKIVSLDFLRPLANVLFVWLLVIVGILVFAVVVDFLWLVLVVLLVVQVLDFLVSRLWVILSIVVLLTIIVVLLLPRIFLVILIHSLVVLVLVIHHLILIVLLLLVIVHLHYLLQAGLGLHSPLGALLRGTLREFAWTLTQLPLRGLLLLLLRVCILGRYSVYHCGHNPSNASIFLVVLLVLSFFIIHLICIWLTFPPILLDEVLILHVMVLVVIVLLSI